MKKGLFVLVFLLLLTSCARIYIVREKTISQILSEITKAPDKFRSERVVISGWAIEGFEHCAIYETKEDLFGNRSDKSLWLENGLKLPFLLEDAYKNGGFTYRFCKVTIEGTVIYIPNLYEYMPPKSRGTAGHMGSWTASMIDTIVTIKSPVEIKVFKSEILKKPVLKIRDPFE